MKELSNRAWKILQGTFYLTVALAVAVLTWRWSAPSMRSEIDDLKIRVRKLEENQKRQ